MASLYDLLCYHSLTSAGPLLKELLSYLSTRFHSHIFGYIANEHSLDGETAHSIDSSVSEFYSDDSTYFSQKPLYLLIFYAIPIFIPQLTGTKHTKGPPAEDNGRPGRVSENPTAPKHRRRRREPPTAPAFPGQSRRGTVGATADG